MGQAKEIRVVPISKKDADALITRLHYSHKTVNNAFLTLGVFLNSRLEGAGRSTERLQDDAPEVSRASAMGAISHSSEITITSHNRALGELRRRMVAWLARDWPLGGVAAKLGLQFHQVDEDIALTP
jgi:hypothetical protein